MNRSPLEKYKARRAEERTCLRIGSALIILALALALWLSVADAAEAGSDGPRTLPLAQKITGQLREVTCGGGCCCGTVAATYQGRWYTANYCKWFRRLTNGQTVTTTGYLQRLYR